MVNRSSTPCSRRSSGEQKAKEKGKLNANIPDFHLILFAVKIDVVYKSITGGEKWTNCHRAVFLEERLGSGLFLRFFFW